MKKRLSTYLLAVIAIIAVLAIIVPVAAYEGHLVDVKAHTQFDIAWFCEHGTTRTPGWWQTHVDAAEWVLTEQLGGSIDMGWPAPITNIEDLMGVFWASQTKNTDNSMRSALCKAKAKASFQVLAAILNSGSPSGAMLPKTMAEIRAIMSGSDIGDINDLHEMMAAFNLSSDYDFLDLGIPAEEMGNANPVDARELADETFADCS
jgi:hypothetical protein